MFPVYCAAGSMAAGRLQGFCAVGPSAAKTNALRAFITAPSAALRCSQGEGMAWFCGGVKQGGSWGHRVFVALSGNWGSAAAVWLCGLGASQLDCPSSWIDPGVAYVAQGVGV